MMKFSNWLPIALYSMGLLLLCHAWRGAIAQAVYVPKPLEDPALSAFVNRPILCSTKNQVPESITTGTGSTYRIPQVFPFACYNVRWSFCNSALSSFGNGPESQTANIVIKAGFEYPAGTIYPITFAGQQTATIAPGGYVTSDPLGMTLPAGAIGRIRTYVQSTGSGNGWPVGGISNPYNSDMSDMVTAANTDLSYANGTGGTYSNGFSSNNSNGWYGPVATTGYAVNSLTPPPGFMLLGDSIAKGALDQPSSSIPNTKIGWMAVGANDTIPWINAGISGDAAHNYVTHGYLRNLIARVGNIKYAMVAYGANDVDIDGSNASGLEADLQTMYNDLANRGIRVIACTITPKTDTSNVAVTASNNVRLPVNAWTRARSAANVYDVIDLEAAVSTIGSGVWSSGTYIADGNHPSTAGHAQMATAFAAKLAAGAYK